MISMLIDDGRLVQVDGRWVAVGDFETISVPPGIHALLAARLERLDADERAVLGRAAVIGQIFYIGALEELASPALSGRIPSRLLELARKELVRPCRSDFVDEDAFEFRHLLIRDAAYDALSKESRADLHARFADWLEAKAGDRLAEYAEIVGWHLEQAYRYLSELGPRRRTGERARATRGRPACGRGLDRVRAWGRLRRRLAPVASPGADAGRRPAPAAAPR